MPRVRRPVEDRLMDGTYQRSRHGPVSVDDESHAAPVKPDGLSEEAGAFWDRIVSLLAGVVRERDGFHLEQMARHWEQLGRIWAVIDGVDPGSVEYNRLLIACGICTDKFDKISSRFGMTPADRTKLKAEAATAKPKVATRPKELL